jgi:hypothetical protein
MFGANGGARAVIPPTAGEERSGETRKGLANGRNGPGAEVQGRVGEHGLLPR